MPERKMSPLQWSILLLTAALFGSSFFFTKIMVADIPPLAAAAGRALVAVFAVFLFLKYRHIRFTVSAGEWWLVGLIGLLTAVIPYAAIAWGQAYIDSALGGILFAIIPVFTLLLTPLLIRGTPLAPVKLLGAFVGLGGVALAANPQQLSLGSGELRGILLTLLAAGSYALGGIITKSRARLAPPVLAAGQLLVAAILLSLLFTLTGNPLSLSMTMDSFMALIGAGVLGTALPVMLFFWLISQVGPARTSLLTFFMPFSALFLGAVILGESLALTAYLGLGLIIAGAFLVNRETAPAPAKPVKQTGD